MNVVEAERVFENLIWQDSDRMSGAICFFGTRIPTSFLFDYIARGQSIEEFACDYGIEVEILRKVVELASTGIESYLQPAA
jgi:hypothetical protein